MKERKKEIQWLKTGLVKRHKEKQGVHITKIGMIERKRRFLTSRKNVGRVKKETTRDVACVGVKVANTDQRKPPH